MTDKKALRWIIALSVVVFAAIVALYMLPKQEVIPAWAKLLPAFNATVNGTCALLLISSLICIKNKNIQWHKRLNLTAFLLSSLFLISYVIFHSYGVETKYPSENPMRPFYLFILLTHIVFAAVVLPLVLVSFYLGLSGQTEKHRKLSKFTYPVWLYVTITGVVVYLMISPYYQF
ncbi:MAG: DUF420 domain-containing protein [Flavobacteriales bacterium]|jgi:putative membrane protein|nr:DUF420 domain-containing protein [Flavobacteriales bacterium]